MVRLQDVRDLLGNGMVQPVLVDLAILLRAEAEGVAASETDVSLTVLKKTSTTQLGSITTLDGSNYGLDISRGIISRQKSGWVGSRSRSEWPSRLFDKSGSGSRVFLD